MKFLHYLFSVILLLNFNTYSENQHNLSESQKQTSYRDELKNFKKSDAYKLIFDEDANPALKEIRRDIENCKELTVLQRLIRSAFLSLSSIVVTSKTMPKLYDYVDEICQKANIKTPIIFVTTGKGFFNAAAQKLFVSSGGIIIGQKLLREISDEELEAVVAHEIGHIKRNHTNRAISTGISAFATSYMLVRYCFEKLQLNIQGNSTPAHIVNVYIQTVISSILSGIATCIIINKRYEKEADKFACEMKKQKGIIGFFERLEQKYEKQDQDFADVKNVLRENRSNLTKDYLSLLVYPCLMLRYYVALVDHKINKCWRWLYYNTPYGEHPSNKARIEAAQESLKKDNSIPEQLEFPA